MKAPVRHRPSLPLLLALLALAAACAPPPLYEDPAPIETTTDPQQEDVTGQAKPFALDAGGWTFRLTPLAHYVLRGVVLGREDYGDDTPSLLSPCDVAVAWGPMARKENYGQYEWSQSGRWYWWQYGPGVKSDDSFVARYTSNTHVIPANDFLARAVAHVRRGNLIEMEGSLVKVVGRRGSQSFDWVSSLSRQDREGGSCELLWLERLKVGSKVYK